MSRLPIGPVPGRPRRPRRLWRWALAAIVLGLLLARWFFVELVVVRGNTGAPTALEGDVLLVVRRAEPAQGDVVLLEHEGREVLRRVIALPGQTVGADEGVLTIDDVPLATRVVGTFAYRELSDGDRARRQQHFIESLPDGRRHHILGDHAGAARPWTFAVPRLEVPPGFLFVLCDNRRTCPDDDLVGLVPEGWSQGVARWLLRRGDARETAVEQAPFYGAWEWISSRAESSGVK
ncbi:MAG: signal peptidase I [Myxococcales bacterium]|nr:signal peptidase I [Myxococcales bacterium]